MYGKAAVAGELLCLNNKGIGNKYIHAFERKLLVPVATTNDLNSKQWLHYGAVKEPQCPIGYKYINAFERKLLVPVAAINYLNSKQWLHYGAVKELQYTYSTWFQ